MNEQGLRSIEIRRAFSALAIFIFLVLELALSIFVINWSRPISIVLFAALTFFNVSFSLLLTKRVLSFFVKPYELPKQQTLITKPTVAILYATMNDVVPECLSSVWQKYPTDVYVLDDSSDPQKRDIVDEISGQRGFTVLRREHRRGFKAGAINNWIETHGQNYDYIVLLDSDSYIPPDWIEEALKFAEHPSNSRISIFQGLINIWNLDNRFVNTLAPLQVLSQDVWEKRLANHLDSVFCYGHNVLVRMSHVREIGGFVEDYVSEDFATAVKLAEKGYKSRFIPLHTYEATPENIRGFIKRQNKWTRGSMEFLSFVKKPNLSTMQRTLLFQTPMGHFAYIIIMITMFLAIFGYYSTTAHLIAFATNLWASNIFYILSIPLFQYVIATSIASGLMVRIKLYQLHVSTWTFFKYELLSKAIGAIMLPYEVKTIIKYTFNKRLSFNVTPKTERTLSFQEVLSLAKTTILIATLLITGLVVLNPLGIFYNITWLAPFAVSPPLIYLFSRKSRNLQPQTGNTMTNGGSIQLTCLYSQPKTVNHLLDSAKTEGMTTISFELPLNKTRIP